MIDDVCMCSCIYKVEVFPLSNGNDLVRWVLVERERMENGKCSIMEDVECRIEWL